MKKLLLALISGLLLLFTIPISLSAQNESDPLPRQEASFSLGYFNYSDWDTSDDDYSDFDYGSPLDNYNSWKTFRGNRKHSPSISLSYHYDLNSHWAAGAYMGYAGCYQNMHNNAGGSPLSKYRDHYLFILPTMRLYYMYRPAVRLYGEMGFGAYIRWKKDFGEDSYSCHMDACGQITVFGISVGKKVFGFGELGYGILGVCRFGIGYRF